MTFWIEFYCIINVYRDFSTGNLGKNLGVLTVFPLQVLMNVLTIAIFPYPTHPHQKKPTTELFMILKSKYSK